MRVRCSTFWVFMAVLPLDHLDPKSMRRPASALATADSHDPTMLILACVPAVPNHRILHSYCQTAAAGPAATSVHTRTCT